MQELVAGILRAMGYKTRISPQWSDLGKDIIASPDWLGLADPRIMVEVKHRKNSMDAPEIRNFVATLRTHLDRWMYVSTWGFTKEARYEAERSSNPVTLINLIDLTDLVISYYDQFDADTIKLLPLKKIYVPEFD
jgi:restriction system protein